METKLCIQCKQPIHPDARVCQHCKSYQSWLGSQRDPRVGIILIIIFLAVFVPVIMYLPKNVGPKEQATPVLTVSNVSLRYLDTPDGSRVFVLGKIKNVSADDGMHIYFRINIYGKGSKVLDTLLVEEQGLIAKAKSEGIFRITGLISVPKEQIEKAEVNIEHVKARTKWD